MLITSKLQFPSTQPDMVARPALLARLRAALRAPLTLVHAPAGYGKTALLSAWRAAEPASAAAWLALDTTDNTPARFWRYCAAALHSARPTLALAAAPPEAVEPILAALARLTESGEDTPLVLILDNYHLIRTSILHESVLRLLADKPPWLHIVLSMRGLPPFPLAGLRAMGKLAEIGVADLRFGPGESAAFLQRTGCPPPTLRALHERSEGWIALLRLAALTTCHPDNTSDPLDVLRASHPFVRDYLQEEVFDPLPTELQTNLIQVAILEQLDAPRCEAITGSDGQHVIETLRQADLLQADEHGWRLHGLFAEFLRERLRRLMPERARTLHRRAADWFAAQGQPVLAAPHSLAATDFEIAAQHIEQAAGELIPRRQSARLLAWLDSLPDSIIRARPALCLYHAWALADCGQFDRLALIDSRLQRAARGLSDLSGAARAALRESAAYVRGDLPVLPPNSLHSEVLRLTQRAQSERAAGQLRSAADDFREAIRSVKGAEDEAIIGMAHAGLATVLREWDELEAAETHAREAIRLAGNRGPEPALVAGFLALAEVRFAQRRLDEALQAIHTARRRAQRMPPGIDAELGAYEARLLLVQGDTDGAARWVQSARLSAEDTPERPDQGYLTLARTLIARRRPDDARTLLDRLVAVSQTPERLPWLIESLVLRALAHQARDDVAAAIADLDRALTLAEPEGFIRRFVDEGLPMAGLLLKWLGPARRRASPYLLRLLSASGQYRMPAETNGQSGGLPFEPLSERELEILRLLARGLSYREIADKLVVAVSTVKTHINTIYGKLHVRSRTQAIAQAEALGLL